MHWKADVNILFVASECAPFVKTGGLADVIGAVPKSLAPLGGDVRVLLPAYPALAAQVADGKEVLTFDDLFGGAARVVAVQAEGLNLLLLDMTGRRGWCQLTCARRPARHRRWS